MAVAASHATVGSFCMNSVCNSQMRKGAGKNMQFRLVRLWFVVIASAHLPAVRVQDVSTEL
jgi:hypothetical protein